MIRTFWASLTFLLSIQRPSERGLSLIEVVIITWVGKSDQLRFSPEYRSTLTYPVIQAANILLSCILLYLRFKKPKRGEISRINYPNLLWGRFVWSVLFERYSPFYYRYKSQVSESQPWSESWSYPELVNPISWDSHASATQLLLIPLYKRPLIIGKFNFSLFVYHLGSKFTGSNRNGSNYRIGSDCAGRA